MIDGCDTRLRHGLEVDIADHVEITRRLAERFGAYVHIQRRAFLVPDEWTREWMQMTEYLPIRGVACEYIVLMNQQAFVEEQRRLESMNQFLIRRKWILKYCDLKDVLDSFGGELPTTWNLDVFDGRIAKLQETPAGRYHGGVKLKMTILDLAHRGELNRLVACVRRFAQPFHAPAATTDRSDDAG